jgi:hypothetical protein
MNDMSVFAVAAGFRLLLFLLGSAAGDGAKDRYSYHQQEVSASANCV